jgi:hypothetical protein
MIKRRSRSQIGNLTPNHKALENMAQMRFNWSVKSTIGKIFSRVIKYFPFDLKKK